MSDNDKLNRAEASKMDAVREPREWIIRRCTQQWIGKTLQYEDFPLGAAKVGWPYPGIMNRSMMIQALDYCNRRWPDSEFQGHNIANCSCPEHSALKSSAD
jgi:hypothetical protein